MRSKEELRKEFVNKFSIDKIKTLTIEEYALGRGNKDCFCYWVEQELNALGNIHGATSSKFGVYYSKEEEKYRWTKWTEENFSNIVNEILSLYKAGQQEDIAAIKSNKLSNMFKGKILSLYFPQRYLNVFSIHHLKHFLDNLNIYSSSSDEVELRELLLSHKKDFPKVQDKTATEFGDLLYHFFGAPTQEEILKEQKINEEWIDIQQKVEIDEIIISQEKQKSTNSIKISYTNPTQKPELIKTDRGKYVFKRNPKMAAWALENANYCCEVEANHKTFTRRKNSKINYTEAHHLIPMAYQSEFSDNIDTPSNIVSLCSHCHNLLHYGNGHEKILKMLYEQRKEKLQECGISISFGELKKFY